MHSRLIAALTTVSVVVLTITPAAAVRPAPGRAVDISSPLTIRDGECSFSPALDAALDRMLTGTDMGRLVPRRVQVGGIQLRSRVVRTAPAPPGGTASFDSVAIFPRAAVWNGLPVQAMVVGTGLESSYQGLRFRASRGMTREQ